MVLSGAAWLVLVAQSMSDGSLAGGLFGRHSVDRAARKPALGAIGWRDLCWPVFLRLCLLRSFQSGAANPFGSMWPWWRWRRLLSARWPGPATRSAASVVEGIIHPAADVLHLLAATAWVGMLLPLALLLWTRGTRCRIGRHRARGGNALFDLRRRQRRHATDNRRDKHLVSGGQRSRADRYRLRSSLAAKSRAFPRHGRDCRGQQASAHARAVRLRRA